MDRESAQIKFLTGVTLLLAALIVVYNAFYIPDAVSFTQISTDGSQSEELESGQTEKDEETNLGKVSINRADETELDTLPGIGPALAKAIVEYREENGGFSSLEELMEVPGIGEKKFAELKDLISLE